MEASGTSEKPGLGIVFNDNHRVWVERSSYWPYYWIGQIAIEFPNGDTGSGTGTLIGPRHVLTCAHNLYQAERGGYAKPVKFSLARNGEEYPFEPVTSSRLFVDDHWKALSPPTPDQSGTIFGEITERVWDYGLIRLEKELNPSNGLFPTMYAVKNNELNRQFDITGYPGDVDPRYTMWNGSGAIAEEGGDDFLFYRISTFRGNSGSAVRGMFPDKLPRNIPWIVGIHVAGWGNANINFAVRLNEDLIVEITDWMHQGA